MASDIAPGRKKGLFKKTASYLYGKKVKFLSNETENNKEKLCDDFLICCPGRKGERNKKGRRTEMIEGSERAIKFEHCHPSHQVLVLLVPLVFLIL